MGIPSTDPDAWYTTRGRVGVDMKWGGNVGMDDFINSLQEMDKSYLSDFQYENDGNGACYYGGE